MIYTESSLSYDKKRKFKEFWRSLVRFVSDKRDVLTHVASPEIHTGYALPLVRKPNRYDPVEQSIKYYHIIKC